MVKGVGAVRLRALLDHFGDLSVAWNAPADALKNAGLSARLVENFFTIRKSINLERIWENIQRQGIMVITWDDDCYPRLLKNIDQPPPILYVRGNILPEDEWAVSIVGTRRATIYGRQVAADLAAHLAQNHITVVSGLARGIDAVAHETAVKAGGRTIAVLGSGVDVIYPPEHRSLAEKIIQQGALVSDYPPGTPPESTNFPPRNRIISGLSLASVVVEAGKESGALITAAFATEQGRDVFAVPGNITAPQSKGPNELIQQGAHPLLNVNDVLEVLQLQQIHEHHTLRLALPLDETETRILKVLGSEPLYIDEIGQKSGLTIDRVSATLALMELKGLIHHVGGMNYTSTHEDKSEYRTD